MEENEFMNIITYAKSMRTFASTIEAIAKGIQRYSGFECVGIRIKNTFGDYPYFKYLGFKDSFVSTENSLCSLDKDGNTKKDADGNPILECICGNIIQERFDPKQPFFTEGGSFWTNSTTESGNFITEKNIKMDLRMICNKEGYESVGLFPLKKNNIILGLLQLNDSKKDMFSRENVVAFEAFAREIGSVVFYAIVIKGEKV